MDSQRYPLTLNGGHVPSNELYPNDIDGYPSSNDQFQTMHSILNSQGNTQGTQNNGYTPSNEIYSNDIDGSPLSNDQSQSQTMSGSLDSQGYTQGIQNSGHVLSNEMNFNDLDGSASHNSLNQTLKRKATALRRPKSKKLKRRKSSQEANFSQTQHRIRKRKLGEIPRRKRSRKNKIYNIKKVQAKIIQWNICGLRGKIPELQLLSNEYNPSVISLQETMFNDKKYVKRLDGSKYNWYLKPGPNPARTGVALAINTSIPHEEIILQTDLLALACRTKESIPITYTSIYISPRKMTASETKAKLQNLIDQLPKPFILMGDFNAHSTEWGSFKDDRWGRIILELIQENNLKLLNSGKSTKISLNYTCMSAVDLTIASNDYNSELNWEIDTDNRGSDHFPILMKTNQIDIQKNHKPNWLLKTANWEKFQSDLINKLPSNEEHDIEKITKTIYEVACANIKRTNGKAKQKKVPWWNKEVKAHIRKRRKALRALKAYKHNDNEKSISISGW